MYIVPFMYPLHPHSIANWSCFFRKLNQQSNFDNLYWKNIYSANLFLFILIKRQFCMIFQWILQNWTLSIQTNRLLQRMFFVQITFSYRLLFWNVIEKFEVFHSQNTFQVFLPNRMKSSMNAVQSHILILLLSSKSAAEPFTTFLTW